MKKEKIRVSFKKKRNTETIKFKSIYGSLFYKWLKEHKDEDVITVSLKDLSCILNVPQSSHTYCYLRPTVLASLQKEFNELDLTLTFSYKVIKGEKIIIKIKR
ncbi:MULTISPECIES: RepB family plasmid replication initiator protein [Clostridium]|uniref:Initiator Replication protein n=1 Tax=Clostridium cadaveris TaxID=1529 RepID=A0A1I2LCW5_9CLOT|nr:RepB family plasmid replication initiator protein [Clostridium cadaveris]MDU4951716.1 RepB family plasmid replication initiator protein [Clostridium sp.]MDM8311333.1 RepB family plasmid replication initiator protein [Clostridium cadaveris]MDY4949240.1 RepB family plasmid replication initiator protein [Clostridium cadaveris]NME64729.1 RepB family plasmid replication initiator protein [Clostridium cadaveris]NWK09661.1 RepB family plasmid replication initiator protein [Clostridium cadaveris]